VGHQLARVEGLFDPGNQERLAVIVRKSGYHANPSTVRGEDRKPNEKGEGTCAWWLVRGLCAPWRNRDRDGENTTESRLRRDEFRELGFLLQLKTFKSSQRMVSSGHPVSRVKQGAHEA
jgi:hypothetical protein